MNSIHKDLKKVKDINYYGFDHKRVKVAFEGNPKYVGTIPIKGRSYAVYFCKKPNRDKGHKDFLMLYGIYDPFMDKTKYFVSGMDSEQMKEHLVINVLRCTKCKSIVYSCDRHHMQSCKCGECAIDGGDLYVKITGFKENYELYTFDVLNKVFVSGPL